MQEGTAAPSNIIVATSSAAEADGSRECNRESSAVLASASVVGAGTIATRVDCTPESRSAMEDGGSGAPAVHPSNEEKPPSLASKLRRRLEKAALDKGDLLRRFGEIDAGIPIVALFFDKWFRAAAMSPDRTAALNLDELVTVARSADGVKIIVSESGRVLVKLDRADALLASSRGPPAEASSLADRTSVSVPVIHDLLTADDGTNKDAAAPGRNGKGELQDVVAKRLRRPVAKGDIVFNTVMVSDKPPSYQATVSLLGQSHRGHVKLQKKTAEHSAALIACEALLSDQSDSRCVPKHSCDVVVPSNVISPDPLVDYKGQLLGWLQARGAAGADSLSFEIVRPDPDEKVFQASVTVQGFGGGQYVGALQTRDAHGSGTRAKHAAQQDAARVAFEALRACYQGTHSKIESVMALRIPVDESVIPYVERIEVVQDNFLQGIATMLGCLDVCPHPLQWYGCRPKGLCLYEAVRCDEKCSPHAISPSSMANRRATALLGHVVEGDAALMDASAHSTGAVLADVQGDRYEAIRVECQGGLKIPSVALNASRGLTISGHPRLPMEYSADSWFGLNPRTLLSEVVKRHGMPYPTFEVEQVPANGQDLFRARVRFQAAIGAAKQSLSCPPPAQGRACVVRQVAMQDAALAGLRSLEDWYRQSSPFDGEHPLARTALQLLRNEALGSQSRAAAGITLVLTFRLWVSDVSCNDAATAPAAVLTMPLLIEMCERLRIVVGSHVIHPHLEDIAVAAVLGSWMDVSIQGNYDGCQAQYRLQLMVHDRAIVAGPTEKVISHELKFDPPLRRQRYDFVLQVLQKHRIRSAVDLGCGEGQLLERLLDAGVQRVVGVDRSEQRVSTAMKRVTKACGEDQLANIILADFLSDKGEILNCPWTGVEAALLIEVVEHLPNKQLSRLPEVVLGCAGQPPHATPPRLVVITTPNADFKMSLSSTECLSRGGDTAALPRDDDHEREWTRAEFRQWAAAVAEPWGYEVAEHSGVGEVPGWEGTRTQIIVLIRKDAAVGIESLSEHGGQRDMQQRPGAVVVLAEELIAAACGAADHVDIAAIPKNALHSMELVPNQGLWKHVLREGSGEPPTMGSRLRVHNASYLASGDLVSASRDGNLVEPCAFQLGGGTVLEAWQRAAATMRRGEVSWIESPPGFAFGELGAPPRIPPASTMWFMLELLDFKPPGVLKSFKELSPALAEAHRHLDIGRADLRRGAYAQARQAFRRAIDAVPEKLLLGQPVTLLSEYAAMERASLLNQALCSLRLAEAADLDDKKQALFEEAKRASTCIIQRHCPELKDGDDVDVATTIAALERSTCGKEMPMLAVSPANTSEILTALRAVSAAADPSVWVSKAFFRRGLAQSHLNSLTDAMSDLTVAHKLAPRDKDVSTHLERVKRLQRKTELHPAKMFVSILDRERAAREAEEAHAALEAKKKRRQERLLREQQQQEQQ